VKALWTSAAAVDATGGRAPVGWHAGGVSIDSRSLSPGDLFVALEGPNFDGHDFAAEALRLGAAAVMVRPGSRTVPPEAPVLEVADTLRGLQALGRAARARADAVIGITGSVGKTGTRAMLEAALRPSGATSASQRSFNNHWGVPLTLARIPCGARFAVLEMGMNRAGELRRLSALARPDVMVVTAVAEAHLAAFGTLEAIAAAKAEAFAHLSAGGTAILPAECPGQEILAQAARAAGAGRIWTFGDAAHGLDMARIVRIGALHDRALKQPRRRGRSEQCGHALPTGGFAKDGDVVRIAAKPGDVLVHPAQRRNLIANAEIDLG